MIRVVSTTSATAAQGRTKTSDGRLRVDYDASDSHKTTAEHLFASAYAASFSSIVAMAAQILNSPVPDDMAVTVDVTLTQEDESGYALQIEIKLSLPGWTREQAEAMIAGAHEACPYSKALQNNVPVKLTVL
jgi:osmotically inducible protein OsmC